MIAIQSNKKLQFPPASVGYVKMEIDLIKNKPSEGIYEIRIIDTCFDKIIEKRLKQNYVQQYTVVEPIVKIVPTVNDYEDVEIIKILQTNTRITKYDYAELKKLAEFLKVDFSNNELILENINNLFKQGLLLTTQQECLQGISGVNKGMYFSKIDDWAIIIEE